jgi:hypothetical protein
MAATRNIMSSALFALPFLGYQPVDISNGEPALQAANLVKQTILGAPFVWPWNRTTFEFPISKEDGQDYYTDIPADQPFGFLEKPWLTDVKGKSTEITVVLSLSQESNIQRPASIAAQDIEDDGNVIFRMNAIPDQAYTLGGSYQRAPIQMTSLASLWSPIPDRYAYIYDWGFLSVMALLTKDVRVPLFAQRFVSHLLGAQDGLNATQRNIFIGNWLNLLTEPTRAAQSAALATQARGGM